MSSLRLGGAERSLVNLLKELDYEKYEVDLLLFQQEGDFLELVGEQVRLINSERLALLYANNTKERINLRHPFLSFEHYWFTFLARKKVPSLEGSRQYRWVKYYKQRIPELRND